MSTEQQDSSPRVEASPESDQGKCSFPTGVAATCGRPVVASGKPGRPTPYCDLPDHGRAKAYAARKRYELAALRSEGSSVTGAAVVVEEEVPARPVSEGRVTLAVLVERLDNLVTASKAQAAQQHGELSGLLDRATEVLRTVGNPEAADHEVEQARREALVLVEAAEGAQADAEHQAHLARRETARAVEERAQADEVAEEALAEVARVRAETAESARVLTEETRAAVEAAQEREHQAQQVAAELRAEMDEVRQAATVEIAEAEEAAERARELYAAERNEAVRLAQEQARVEVEAAQARVTEAEKVTATAKAETAAAQQAAERDREALDLARDEMAELRRVHLGAMEAERGRAARQVESLETAHDGAMAEVAERMREVRAESVAVRTEMAELRTSQKAELAELHQAHRAELEQVRAAEAVERERLISQVERLTEAVTGRQAPEAPAAEVKTRGRRQT
ncbi:MAG: hypothetical protein ABIQ18_32015 [Umezawaea sp.]